MSVTSRDSLALCLVCWKKAGAERAAEDREPVPRGVASGRRRFPCGTPPPSCPSDADGMKCTRTIAKAGIKLFLARRKGDGALPRRRARGQDPGPVSRREGAEEDRRGGGEEDRAGPEVRRAAAVVGHLPR